MTDYNIPLAEQTMQFILDHPQQHNQKEWFTDNKCGTVGCFFGWAAHLETHVNHRPRLTHTDSPDVYRYGGRLRHVQDLAAELLGIPHDEARIMFDAENTIDDLQSMVKTIANGETLTEWFDQQR